MSQDREDQRFADSIESEDERRWNLERKQIDYFYFRGLALALLACQGVIIWKAKAWGLSTKELIVILLMVAPFVKYCLTWNPDKPKESITEKVLSLIRSYNERKQPRQPTPQLEENRRPERLVEATNANAMR